MPPNRTATDRGKQAKILFGSGGEAFDNQEQIKRQHEDGSPYRRDLRRAVIDEAAQDIGPPGEIDEGDHRKWQGGAENHLAQHERLGGIDTDRDNDKGRRHSGQAPQPHRDAEANKALHDDLPGHRPDDRTRHARGEQREQEGAGGGGAEQRRQALVRGGDLDTGVGPPRSTLFSSGVPAAAATIVYGRNSSPSAH